MIYFDAMHCTLVHMCPRQFPRLISISSPDINYVNSTRKVKFECIWIFCPRICCICILLQFVQSLEFLLAKLARWWLFYFELRTCRQFPNFKHSRWVVTKACIQTTPKRLQNGREFWFKFKIGSAAFEKKKSAQRWLLLLLPTCCCVATSFPSASVRHMSELPLSGLPTHARATLVLCIQSHINATLTGLNSYWMRQRFQFERSWGQIQSEQQQQIYTKPYGFFRSTIQDNSNYPFQTVYIGTFKNYSPQMAYNCRFNCNCWHLAFR